MALVKAIITDPRIYSRMTDDASPVAELYEPLEHEEMIYILVRVDGEPRGVWALIPHSRIMYEVHTCLLPEIWGPVAHEASHQFLSWIWENTSCLRLITSVPQFNRTALAFARAAGMTEYGRNPMAYQKYGKLWDITMLGISRPEAP